MWSEMSVVSLLCAMVVVAVPWNHANNPDRFGLEIGSGFEYKLRNLARAAELKHVPWSDTYWPSYQSGIAHRWNAHPFEDFKYKLFSKQELINMTLNEKKSLSPAEKYSIFVRRYDYPLVRSEWSRTSPHDAKWEGLCHGWAPAASQFAQPKPVVIKNADGIEIPFGSSDVKALLTYFAAQYDHGRQTAFLAQRCNADLDQEPRMLSAAECVDMNAASMHVLMTNVIGKLGVSFVIDRDRGLQVWNQPVSSYESSLGTISKNNNSQGFTVDVRTRIYFAVETLPAWEAHPAYISHKTYDYTLELDSEERIIGGSYPDIRADRIDFAWLSPVNKFHGFFSHLKQLYEASTGSSPPEFDAFELVSNIPSESTLSGLHGSFSHSSYESQEHKMWSIAPRIDVGTEIEGITITFTRIDTQRHRDTIRIYENADGTGALVAVLHGHYSEPVIVPVMSSGALVVFTSESSGSQIQGFEAQFVATQAKNK
jgi:hypothetical protein